ncbi:MAG: hypothetical protein IKH54_00780 [Bacilli bacterium]|nr:hypothetical protein [Bacilli bacterium]
MIFIREAIICKLCINLIIFYKSFDTSYSYTKIGHINNLPDLGNENISIRIEK